MQREADQVESVERRGRTGAAEEGEVGREVQSWISRSVEPGQEGAVRGWCRAVGEAGDEKQERESGGKKRRRAAAGLGV